MSMPLYSPVGPDRRLLVWHEKTALRHIWRNAVIGYFSNFITLLKYFCVPLTLYFGPPFHDLMAFSTLF